MDYLPIYFIFMLMMAGAGGTSLFFTWRIFKAKQISNKHLLLALISGFIFWFFVSIIFLFTSVMWKDFAIRWFGANGWSLSAIAAMAGILLHHQLLILLAKK